MKTQDITAEMVIDILNNASIRVLREAIPKLNPIVRSFIEGEAREARINPDRCACNESDVYDGYASCPVHEQPTNS